MSSSLEDWHGEKTSMIMRCSATDWKAYKHYAQGSTLGMETIGKYAL